MYTSHPDVQVPENECELGQAVEGWLRQGQRACILACGLGGSIFLSFLILSAATKLPCTYSGFSNPRVEWKFVQGKTTALVCYNSQITGKLSQLLRTAK